jgi:hypothetical protein
MTVSHRYNFRIIALTHFSNLDKREGERIFYEGKFRKKAVGPLLISSKSPKIIGAFALVNGGGGGNRTRVREPSGRASTYIACVLISLFQSPAGRISEELAYEVSPLIL